MCAIKSRSCEIAPTAIRSKLARNSYVSRGCIQAGKNTQSVILQVLHHNPDVSCPPRGGGCIVKEFIAQSMQYSAPMAHS